MSLRQGAQSPGGYLPNGAGPAGQFGVDLHTMTAAAGHVETVGDAMAAEVNRLLERLSGLVGTNWDSPAARAFQAAQEEWEAAHRNMHVVLHQIAGGLRSTHGSYDQAEQHNLSGITAAVRDLGK
jgi:WXG100 family type VII secretion target